MLVATDEPEGGRIRQVYPMRADQVDFVWKQMQGVQNFTGSKGRQALVDPGIHVLLIDDVGAAALDDLTTTYARVHITFWDKRLRGREFLCRRIAQFWMDRFGLSYLYTSIPTEMKMVIRFCERVGFQEITRDESYTYLVLQNVYLLRANSSHKGR